MDGEVTFRADANKYERAAVYVVDALHGRSTMAQDKWAFFFHRLYINIVYINAYRLCTILLLALAFWEGPSYGTEDALDKSEYALLYCIAETLLIGLFCFDTFLQYKDLGRARFLAKRWVNIKVVCLFVFVVDLLITIFMVDGYIRFVRVLWPVMFIERNENVRKIVGSLVHAIPRILNVMILVMVHITVFGVFAFVLFSGITEENCTAWGEEPPPTERCSTFTTTGCSDYFQTLGQSILQLFVLSTTANFPDVMIPAYQCNRWSAWFFVIFLIIGLYFLVNLAIAVTYTTFQELSLNKILTKHNRLFKGLSLAFSELTKGQLPVRPRGVKSRGKKDKGDGIEMSRLGTSSRKKMVAGTSMRKSKLSKLTTFLVKDDWVCFMKTFRPDLPMPLTRKLFDVMDVTGDGMIVAEEFQQLVYHFAKLKAVERSGSTSRHSSVVFGDVASSALLAEMSNRRTTLRRRVAGALVSGRANTIFDGFVVLNTALVCLFLGLEKDRDLGSLTTGQLVVEGCLLFTLSVFALEVVSKAIFCGPLNYFHGRGLPPLSTSSPNDTMNPLTTSNPGAPGASPAPPKAPTAAPQGAGRSSSQDTAASRGGDAKMEAPASPRESSSPSVAARARRATSEPVVPTRGTGGDRSRGDTSSPSLSRPSQLARSRAGSGASTGSGTDAEDEPTMLYPLFVEGVTDYADGQLWKVDPLFNKLDIIVLLLSVVVLVLNRLDIVSDRVAVAVTIFRLLRIFRALRSVPGFSVTVYSFMQIVPLLSRYFAVLFCVLFSFAVAGMELFAGRLSPDDAEVVASSYGVNDYWPNNFDTLQSSIMVLFEQLVINNWPIVMEGCVAATTLWARVYFVLFYGFSVLCVLSVLLAFLLEAFAIKREYNQKVMQVRKVRKADGHVAANQLEQQVLGEPWANLLRLSGIDFTAWTLSRQSHHSDIYDMLFRNAIQETHSYTRGSRATNRSMFIRRGVSGAMDVSNAPTLSRNNSSSTRRRAKLRSFHQG